MFSRIDVNIKLFTINVNCSGMFAWQDEILITSRHVQIMPRKVISKNIKDAIWKVKACVHTNKLENAQAMSKVNVIICHSITLCTLKRGCNHERFSR